VCEVVIDLWLHFAASYPSMGFPIRISRFSRRRSAPPTLWT